MNLALISKWIWKIAQNDDSLWARVLKAKYFSDSSLFTTKIDPAFPVGGPLCCQAFPARVVLGLLFSIMRLRKQNLQSLLDKVVAILPQP